jgi:hypothetical protein
MCTEPGAQLDRGRPINVVGVAAAGSLPRREYRSRIRDVSRSTQLDGKKVDDALTQIIQGTIISGYTEGHDRD